MRRTELSLGSARYLLARMLKKIRPSAVRDSVIDPTAAVESGCQIVQSEIGRHSFCGYDCTILNVSIGSFCSISDQVFIGGAAHPLHFVSTSPVFLSHRDSVKAKFARHDYQHLPRTSIGHDVWIGFGARIGAGVTIGHGAVVGMGAVVVKDVADYTIVAGNPARVIRRRFDDRIIAALLKSNWWAYDDDELRAAAHNFDTPERFLLAKGLL